MQLSLKSDRIWVNNKQPHPLHCCNRWGNTKGEDKYSFLWYQEAAGGGIRPLPSSIRMFFRRTIYSMDHYFGLIPNLKKSKKFFYAGHIRKMDMDVSDML